MTAPPVGSPSQLIELYRNDPQAAQGLREKAARVQIDGTLSSAQG